MSTTNPDVISVTDLTMSIKYYLEEKFFSLWVSGEVTGLSQPASGHVYFSLKDSRSQIKAVIWRSNAERLNLDFLEDGLEVMGLGNIDVYGQRGVYQLNFRKLQPVGQGALQLAFRKLHAKLDAEGLFDPSHKNPLPKFPKRVAVITSPTGAAIRDFLQVVNRRWANLEIIVVPVQVQGENSAEQIKDAIYACADFADRPDVIVVTRGGGSIEDLWSFNDERVCRAIFNSPIPVISGVGHEIDVTLSDLVADMRALTPSEAAERLVPDQREITEMLEAAKRRMKLSLEGRLVHARQQLEFLASRPVIAQPLATIRAFERDLDEAGQRVRRLMGQKVDASKNEMKTLTAQLEMMNPLSVLARGYSLTTDENGQLVVDSKQVAIGDKIASRLGQGSLVSRIEKIQ